jgi:hypothetical protein
MTFDRQEAIDAMIGLATGALSEDGMAVWIRKHLE